MSSHKTQQVKRTRNPRARARAREGSRSGLGRPCLCMAGRAVGGRPAAEMRELGHRYGRAAVICMPLGSLGRGGCARRVATGIEGPLWEGEDAGGGVAE